MKAYLLLSTMAFSAREAENEKFSATSAMGDLVILT
jgi:hypothetical protein